MTREQELLLAIGKLALKLVGAEEEQKKTADDREFWKNEWDKLRFVKKEAPPPLGQSGAPEQSTPKRKEPAQ